MIRKKKTNQGPCVDSVKNIIKIMPGHWQTVTAKYYSPEDRPDNLDGIFEVNDAAKKEDKSNGR